MKIQNLGLRYDDGKSRVDLIPADALLVLGNVYGYGATKYAPRNWEKGMHWSRVLGPLLRHLYKWMSGELIDAESGQPHIAMVAWNAIGLLTYEIRKIGINDIHPEETPSASPNKSSENIGKPKTKILAPLLIS